MKGDLTGGEMARLIHGRNGGLHSETVYNVDLDNSLLILEHVSDTYSRCDSREVERNVKSL